MHERLHERHESLWPLTAAPLAWAAHLLASYITAAIYCEKSASAAVSLSGVRLAILMYSGLALAVIAGFGIRGYRRHRFADSEGTHSFDSPEDRHRFLGLASLLLAGLSGVAVIYQALPALFIGSCR